MLQRRSEPVLPTKRSKWRGRTGRLAGEHSGAAAVATQGGDGALKSDTWESGRSGKEPVDPRGGQALATAAAGTGGVRAGRTRGSCTVNAARVRESRRCA